jgi:hypothetical protein
VPISQSFLVPASVRLAFVSMATMNASQEEYWQIIEQKSSGYAICREL